MDTNFLAGQASIWIQPNGPNTKPEYLGCHGVGDMEEPQGDITLLFCPDPANAGKFKVKNSFQGTPEPATATIDTDVRTTADYLETIKFPVPIYVHKVEAGRRDDFTNFERSFILRQTRVTSRSLAGLASRNPDDEGESTQSFELAALELLRVFNLEGARATIAETQGLTGIAIGGEDRPESGSLAAQEYGDIIAVTTEAGTGVTANVLLSTDGGAPTATSADPFGADEDIRGVAVFKVGKSTTRILVGRGTTDAANPPEIAYSDDEGATWTAVDLGVTDAFFVEHPHALFALDARNIWVGLDNGMIYYSEDGGVTWTQQADLGTDGIAAIHFVDDQVGYAVDDTGDVYKTSDGGETWGAGVACGTAGVAHDIHAVSRFSVFVATGDGLYYSTDGGATFAQRNSYNLGAVDFRNELEGIAAGFAGSGLIYQTIDGGYTWSALTLVANSGHNDVKWINSRKAIAVGGASSGTGLYVVLTPAG